MSFESYSNMVGEYLTAKGVPPLPDHLVKIAYENGIDLPMLEIGAAIYRENATTDNNDGYPECVKIFTEMKMAGYGEIMSRINNNDMEAGLLIEMIDQFVEKWPNSEFGPAHIVISDRNFEDEHLLFCLREIRKIERIEHNDSVLDCEMKETRDLLLDISEIDDKIRSMASEL